MSESNRAVRNSAFAFLAIATQLLGTSVIFFIIARMDSISIDDFGRLTFAFAFAQMTAIFFEYGLSQFLAKKIAAGDYSKEDERSSYGLHLGLMLLGYLIFCLLVQIFNLEPLTTKVCYWIGASVFATTSLRFFYGLYQGRERHNSEFISTIVEISVQVTAVVIIFVLQLDVLSVAKYYFFGRLLAWLGTFFVFSASDYFMVPVINASLWRKILIEALPFNLTLVAAFAITSLDTVLLHKLAPENPEYQVGLYQAAIRLVLIPTILATVATRVFLPQLSRMGGDTTSHLRHLNNILLLLGIFAGLFFYFNARYLTELAYGSNYGEAADILALLAVTMALRFGAAFNLYFTLADQMWSRFAFACIALSSLVVFNFLLIPEYGVLGTVYASILTHIIYWLPVVFLMWRQERDPLLGWRWIYALGVSVAYALTLWSTQSLGFWFAVIISIPFTALALAFSVQKDIRLALISGLLKRN